MVRVPWICAPLHTYKVRDKNWCGFSRSSKSRPSQWRKRWVGGRGDQRKPQQEPLHTFRAEMEIRWERARDGRSRTPVPGAASGSRWTSPHQFRWWERDRGEKQDTCSQVLHLASRWTSHLMMWNFRSWGKSSTCEVIRQDQIIRGNGFVEKRGTQWVLVAEFFQLRVGRKESRQIFFKWDHQKGRGEAKKDKGGNTSKGFQEKVGGSQGRCWAWSKGTEQRSLDLVRKTPQEIQFQLSGNFCWLQG